jgi:two-component sensor histidine kinase
MPSVTVELTAELPGRMCSFAHTAMMDGARLIRIKIKTLGGCCLEEFPTSADSLGGHPSSSEAVSIGLIVTELVINALKHAFPSDQNDGRVIVAYDFAEPKWRLTVSDNGIGKPKGHLDKTNPGLGTSIIEALAKQLDARVDVLMDPHGTTVSITHATFTSRPPATAQMSARAGCTN